MERQLKERLIGAAVLVAAAVVMVPEMFSGPREAMTTEVDAKPAANQIKTYRVELQSPAPAAAVATPVEMPTERPSGEAQAMRANTEAPDPAPSADEQNAQTLVTQTARQEAAVSVPPAKQETAKPTSTATTNNATTGGWVVQIGSFSAQDKAQQIAVKLKGQGFPAFVGPVQSNGKTLYRVRVGAMADRASADATLQKLRGSYPGASVVAPGH